MRLILMSAIFGLVLAAVSAEAAPMKFQILDYGCPEECSKVLFGDGDIAYTSDQAFRSALRKAGPKTPVILNSRGGDLAGGLNLGHAFREAGISVGVAPGGECFSACAYALFGGVNRLVLFGGTLGVHQFIEVGRDGKPSPTEKHEIDAIVEHLTLYARAMGVSPKVIHIARTTPYESIKILSPTQLRRLRITTGG
jgi:hypothetical protein